MNTSMRLLLASAAFLFATASHCLAASEVTMDLTGQVLKSGSTLKVSSGTETIDAAPLYTYSITGIVTGTGSGSTAAYLAMLTGTGINISGTDGLFSEFKDGYLSLAPYLSGTVVNPSAKLPYTVINKEGTGEFAFTLDNPEFSGTGYVIGTARIKAGISKTGVCYGEITNVRFAVKLPRLAALTDKTDYFYFDSGQIVVQTLPFGGPPQPDLSADLGGSVYYAGVTGTDPTMEEWGDHLFAGKSHTDPVILRNLGSAADSYILTATKPTSPFSEVFIYKGVNITSKVTGTGFTTPVIPPGGIITLGWEMKSANSTAFAVSTGNLTATSKTNGAVDVLQYAVYH